MNGNPILNPCITEDMLRIHFYCIKVKTNLNNKQPNNKFTCERENNRNLFFFRLFGNMKKQYI